MYLTSAEPSRGCLESLNGHDSDARGQLNRGMEEEKERSRSPAGRRGKEVIRKGKVG